MAEYLSEKDMNTGEYISREELLKSLTQECKDCEHDDPYWCEQCDFAIAMSYARYAPKADVQPAKHGRWSECYTDSHHYSGICSICGRASIKSLTESLYEYCPKCGARMDGDTNDD